MSHLTRDEAIEKIQNVDALRAHGMSLLNASKKVGMSPPTYFIWKAKLDLPNVPRQEKLGKVRRIVPLQVPNGHDADAKILLAENLKLKILIAEYALDIQALKEFAGER